MRLRCRLPNLLRSTASVLGRVAESVDRVAQDVRAYVVGEAHGDGADAVGVDHGVRGWMQDGVAPSHDTLEEISEGSEGLWIRWLGYNGSIVDGATFFQTLHRPLDPYIRST